MSKKLKVHYQRWFGIKPFGEFVRAICGYIDNADNKHITKKKKNVTCKTCKRILENNPDYLWQEDY